MSADTRMFEFFANERLLYICDLCMQRVTRGNVRVLSQKRSFLTINPVLFTAHALQAGDLRGLGSAVGSLGAAYGSVGRYSFCACARSGT